MPRRVCHVTIRAERPESAAPRQSSRTASITLSGAFVGTTRVTLIIDVLIIDAQEKVNLKNESK
jgi:hypothetical protein